MIENEFVSNDPGPKMQKISKATFKNLSLYPIDFQWYRSAEGARRQTHRLFSNIFISKKIEFVLLVILNFDSFDQL